MIRRAAGLVMLGLGLFLAWGAYKGASTYVAYGASVADYFTDPGTGILSMLRVAGSALMIIGGGLTIAAGRFSGTVSTIGSALILFMGVAMMLANADQSMWMMELMYGLAATALSVLILTLRRA